jgi:lactate 2-monooxygenase
MVMDIAGSNYTGPYPPPSASLKCRFLFRPRTPEITLSLLKRIKATNFTALVVTLDTMSVGWRPHDVDTAYLPFIHGLGIQVGTSDPVFMARYHLEPETTHLAFPYLPQELDELSAAGDETVKKYEKLGVGWLTEVVSGTYKTWEDLKFLRDNWDGPLILKGIQCVQDAELALHHGADGIVVSNHGGRQVDGGVSSLWALEKICKSPKILEAQASGKFTILFDSSVRTGSDIFKALALGAQAILSALFHC